jgi:hypothetical protein
MPTIAIYHGYPTPGPCVRPYANCAIFHIRILVVD